MRTVPRLKICGVNFDNISLPELEAFLRDVAGSGEGQVFIVTPNVDFVIRAAQNEEFKNILNKADLSLCDSSIVLLGSLILRKTLKSRVTGFDATHILLTLSAETSEKVFLLGSTDENLKLVSEKLSNKYPRLSVSGMHNGFFSFTDSQMVIDKINSSDASFLFIGMGSPRQEQWISSHRSKINAKYIICIGGLFEVLSERIKRAPVFMQKLGLEWFWRLINEPKRLWKRYLVEDIYFFRLIFKEMLRGVKKQ
ncbi:MAG: WecB/TagA/CpsF family glycosyltransferase [Candidatus Omnitrophica bacterium]|nr:WecB/TagA/CpsF family glycosyltransferase [Candidatus Omnitrophota bacterium]